jgi:hypothetical protein
LKSVTSTASTFNLSRLHEKVNGKAFTQHGDSGGSGEFNSLKPSAMFRGAKNFHL